MLSYEYTSTRALKDFLNLSRTNAYRATVRSYFREYVPRQHYHSTYSKVTRALLETDLKSLTSRVIHTRNGTYIVDVAYEGRSAFFPFTRRFFSQRSYRCVRCIVRTYG
jgi:hypothetical protein